MAARDRSITSGQVDYTYRVAFPGDARYAAVPGFREQEIERQVARDLARADAYHEPQGRGPLAREPGQDTAYRRMAEEHATLMARGFEVYKQGIYTWSGSKWRSDMGETGQRIVAGRQDLGGEWRVSVIAHDGAVARSYAHQGFLKIVGSVRDRVEEALEVARMSPLRWMLRWDAPALVASAEEFLLAGKEEREGKTAFWLRRVATREVALICPEMGYCVIESRRLREDGTLASRAVAEDITSVNGVFFPGKVTVTCYRDSNAVASQGVFVVRKAAFNEDLNPELFTPAFPPGAVVTDHRGNPPFQYTVEGRPDMAKGTLLDLAPRALTGLVEPR